jgi:hypothetical protein
MEQGIRKIMERVERETRERVEREMRERKMIEQKMTKMQKQAQVERENMEALERERKEERALELGRQRKAQAEMQILVGALNRSLKSNFMQPLMTKTLPQFLRGMDAQMVVDFLNDVGHVPSFQHDLGAYPTPIQGLDHSEILWPGERKQLLYLLCKIVKSAQIFPKAIELTGVECDLSQPIVEGGFGVIYKGKYQNQAVCVKAVRMYQVGAKKQALRVRPQASAFIVRRYELIDVAS